MKTQRRSPRTAPVKRLTRQLPVVDIRHLARAGILALELGWSRRWILPGTQALAVTATVQEDGLRLRVRRGFEHNAPGFSQSVQIEHTPCHYGGARAWFICPTPRCGRRVATLYIEDSLACRTCLRLAYASTRDTALDRVHRRAVRLRERLGWHRSRAPGLWVKPKWMRWSTVGRLFAEHERCMAFARAALKAKIETRCPLKS